MADPDFELRRGPGFILLVQLAFLPSVISSFFTQNKEGGPPGPSPRSATEYFHYTIHTAEDRRQKFHFCRLPFDIASWLVLGSFSKPRWRGQQERRQTKGLMSKIMVLQVRFESLYISFLSSAKQQREMTKSYVFWRTCTAMANFSCLPLESNTVVAYLD